MEEKKLFTIVENDEGDFAVKKPKNMEAYNRNKDKYLKKYHETKKMVVCECGRALLNHCMKLHLSSKCHLKYKMNNQEDG